MPLLVGLAAHQVEAPPTNNALFSLKQHQQNKLQEDDFDDDASLSLYGATGNSLDFLKRSRVMLSAAKKQPSPATCISWLTSNNSGQMLLPSPGSTISRENPFPAIYEELFTENSQPTRSSTPFESIFHLCSPYDFEPFVGLLTVRASFLSCCPLKSFITLSPEHPQYKTSFTPFGKRLLQICFLQGKDLRFHLSDELLPNWQGSSSSSRLDFLKKFLQHTVDRYVDSDKVEWLFGECSVCFSSCRFVRRPSCCRQAICYTCWQQYVRSVAASSATLHLTGMYDLHCFGCNKIVPYSQVLSSLEPDDVALIRPPGQIASGSRCPACLQPPPPFTFDEKNTKKEKFLAKISQKKGGHPAKCNRCATSYCGYCGCDVHPKTSCQELITTDLGFNKWMKEKSIQSPEFPNGRHCPACNIPIAREGGCPNMICQCGATFCYSCGKKKIKAPFYCLGHTSNRMLPLFSCPKLWRSQRKRLLVHSLVSLGVLAGFGPLAIVVAPVAVPVGLLFCLIAKLRK